jgi:hypothetical protein
MDSALPEWYGHDDDALKRIVTTGTIALDANVMLDLYRVGRDQREQILSVLRSVRNRLFVPYQAAFEFQKNRLKVAADSEKFYNALASKLQVTTAQLDQIQDPKIREQVREAAESAHKDLAEALKKIQDEHIISFGDVRRNDPVRAALDEILADESIGQKPSDTELAERKKTANQRIEDRRPPGYADAKNKEDPTGDYLVWAELLDHMRGASRPLLFVTSDDKEDWTSVVSNRKIGPRPELRAEMHAESPHHPYHHVTLAAFLALAKKFLDAAVEESTIDTVDKIARPVKDDQIFLSGAAPKFDPALFDSVRRSLDSTENDWLAEAKFRNWARHNRDYEREWEFVTSILSDPKFRSTLSDARKQELTTTARFLAVLKSFMEEEQNRAGLNDTDAEVTDSPTSDQDGSKEPDD